MGMPICMHFVSTVVCAGHGILQVGRQPLLVTWPGAAGQEPTQRTYPTPTTPMVLLQQLQVSAGQCAALGAETAGNCSNN